jgi:hypothetical protein
MRKRSLQIFRAEKHANLQTPVSNGPRREPGCTNLIQVAPETRFAFLTGPAAALLR